ncbi:MAG: 4-hydroxy-tetrahydrodipicolinate synthase [Flavobacteriaceae bacterium]|nr:4-hydroxy-tetrahydrodipicolinate synthase [Flavobacteriaceae bacterium]
MNKNLIGTGVALITPFDAHGNIDHSGLANLVNHSIDCGVDYLVLMGTTAESVTLLESEKEAALETIIATNNGRKPLVLGIGGNNTADIIQQIQSKDLSIFEAILSVSPAYNRPTQEGIYQHFRAISESTDKSIILYNVPSRTATNVEPETTLRLAHDFKNIIAIKEAAPAYMQSSFILKNKPQDFMVISGDDAFALPMVLAGGAGVISVIGQAIPQYSEMIRLGIARKVDEAYDIFYQIFDLTNAIYKEGNPAGIKALLEIVGVCQRDTRLPLISASDKLNQEIHSLWQKLSRA